MRGVQELTRSEFDIWIECVWIIEYYTRKSVLDVLILLFGVLIANAISWKGKRDPGSITAIIATSFTTGTL